MKSLFSLLILLIGTLPASAGSSVWFQTDGAKIRLIALPSPDGGMINAGLQIELEKGWKTYWRSPGASGLPPQLDFSDSTNIATTKVEYPVPTTFGDAKNLTAGYKGSVTFPISVEPLFPNRPVTISANGLIGLCEEICVPVQFQLSLLEDGKGTSTADVAGALLRSKLAKMGNPRSDFQIEKTFINGSKLIVEAKIPEGSSSAALLVEGPSDWYLTPVLAQSSGNGKAQFEIDLSDIPKEAQPEQTTLTFSLVSGGDGVEQKLKPIR